MIKSRLATNTSLSPNFTAERGGRLPKAVVVHKGEGSYTSIIDWFMQPVSQVSSHYVISLKGEIMCMVEEQNTAWHAGKVITPTWPGLEPAENPNKYTIGIELEGYASGNTPLVQQVALCELVAEIFHRYKIEANAETLVFHREINGAKTCPGMNITKDTLLGVIKIITLDNIAPIETTAHSNDHSSTFQCA